jgi:hypothetical protein
VVAPRQTAVIAGFAVDLVVERDGGSPETPEERGRPVRQGKCHSPVVSVTFNKVFININLCCSLPLNSLRHS